jgi:blocked-early-in-transport protein 1
LSIDINAEVRDQNSMLDGMGSSLGQTTDLLTSTIGKIGVMVSSGGSKHMCYLVLFVVVFFMMLYFMMRK